MFELLHSLINLPSLYGEEGALGIWLEQWFLRHGYQVHRQYLQPSRFNLIAVLTPNPRILFCTHLDTVAPHLPCSEDENNLYGRGACDAKGILFSMLLAAEQLRRGQTASVGFLLVVGEEGDSDGAKYAAQQGLHCEYIILGEPTENKLVSHQKGALVFAVEVRGRAGHSGYPELGFSAVHHLNDAIHRWRGEVWGADELLGPTTLNIGVIRGGTGANVIADYAQAEGIFRVSGNLALLVSRLMSFQDDHLRIFIKSSSPAQTLFTLPGYPTQVVSFGSDAAYLAPIGKVMMTGPGSIRYAHQPDERIGKEELLFAVDQYGEIVQKLLSR